MMYDHGTYGMFTVTVKGLTLYKKGDEPVTQIKQDLDYIKEATVFLFTKALYDKTIYLNKIDYLGLEIAVSLDGEISMHARRSNDMNRGLSPYATTKLTRDLGQDMLDWVRRNEGYIKRVLSNTYVNEVKEVLNIPYVKGVISYNKSNIKSM